MRLHRYASAVAIVALLAVPAAMRAQSTPPGSPLGVGLLPATIPILPLYDVVLFPNISRPVHIFEPRYRAMIADALKGDRIVGMVLLRAGHEAEYDGRPPVYPIGCAGVITEAEELPDGRYLIELRGLVKFQITSEDQSRPYRLAAVEAIPETPADEERTALRQRRGQIAALLAASVPGSPPPPPEISDDDLVNGLAQFLTLDPLKRQELLELKGPLERSDRLIELMKATAAAQP